MNRTQKFILVFLAANLVPAIALGNEVRPNLEKDLRVSDLEAAFMNSSAEIQDVNGVKSAVLQGTVYDLCADKFSFKATNVPNDDSIIGMRVTDLGGGMKCMADLKTDPNASCGAQIKINGDWKTLSCKPLLSLGARIPLAGHKEGAFKLVYQDLSDSKTPYKTENFKSNPEYLSADTLHQREVAHAQAISEEIMRRARLNAVNCHKADNFEGELASLNWIKSNSPDGMGDLGKQMQNAIEEKVRKLENEALELANGTADDSDSSDSDSKSDLAAALDKLDEARSLNGVSAKTLTRLNASRSRLVGRKNNEELKDQLAEIGENSMDPKENSKAQRQYNKLLAKAQRKAAKCQGRKAKSDDCAGAQEALAEVTSYPVQLQQETLAKQQAAAVVQQQAQQAAIAQQQAAIAQQQAMQNPQQPSGPGVAPPGSYAPSYAAQSAPPFAAVGIQSFAPQPQPGIQNGLNGIPTAQSPALGAQSAFSSVNGIPTAASNGNFFRN